jgi:hypothetical protein
MDAWQKNVVTCISSKGLSEPGDAQYYSKYEFFDTYTCHSLIIRVSLDKMSYTEIRNIFKLRADAKTKNDADYADICIEWMRTLPLEAGPGVLFQTPAGEAEYLTSIGLLIELASDFEKNKSTIGHICAGIDAIPLTATPGLHSTMYHILRETVSQSWSHLHVSYIAVIRREMKNAITQILETPDPTHRKMLVDLFDRYIMSLAIVGPENALSCYKKLTKLGRRVINFSTMDDAHYKIQSIGDPEFSMRDFLLAGPVCMFYGYEEPAEAEITHLTSSVRILTTQRLIGDDSYYRDRWPNHKYRYGYPCTKLVAAIHGIPRGPTGALQFKKLYPNEHLNLVRVLTRLT